MKLYTEEQVKQIFENLSVSSGYDYNMETYCDSITPIELPSDEEIEKELLKHSNITQIDPYKSFYFNAAMYGAKWMKEQLLKPKQITWQITNNGRNLQS